ncbi:hypothetical protein HW130_01230 [Streptomyces sp. PKU-EA00015]|uniref:DUF6126 family protein n=1 Tax=unclassified Streptomyces TaxID=2593676 RepID=UPI0015A17B15|nr:MULTISPECIES: DUF6126 family protein [unclassified Streptomyces]MDQ1007016.1 hypothetical protein [Streptomyces sp. V4I23]NWF24896.1 hypothetical protein [Streptomyces sp. PKU-EA00015]
MTPTWDPLDKPLPDTPENRREDRFPRGLVIRLFAYLVAGHLVAAFLYLLFLVGGQNQ